MGSGFFNAMLKRPGWVLLAYSLILAAALAQFDVDAMWRARNTPECILATLALNSRCATPTA